MLQPSVHLWDPPFGPTPAGPYPCYAGDHRAGHSTQVGAHESREEGDNFLLYPAGRAAFGAAQDMVGLAHTASSCSVCRRPSPPSLPLQGESLDIIMTLQS